MMLKSFIRTAVWSIVTVFAFTYPVTAQHSNKESSSEADRAIEASTVLTEIMNIPESSIPEELMGRAHGIAVIPHVVKGAFGIGGQWGKGLMSRRHEDGRWSPPAYVEIGGGSFGLQIGVEASDIVLIDDSANRKIYGKDVTGEQILLGNAVRTNATVEPFLETLHKVSPPHIHITKATQK